jgi:hypothetical protein
VDPTGGRPALIRYTASGMRMALLNAMLVVSVDTMKVFTWRVVRINMNHDVSKIGKLLKDFVSDVHGDFVGIRYGEFRTDSQIHSGMQLMTDPAYTDL